MQEESRIGVQNESTEREREYRTRVQRFTIGPSLNDDGL